MSAEWSGGKYYKSRAFQYHLERYREDLGSFNDHEREFYRKMEVNG
jgi:hypothetical protein